MPDRHAKQGDDLQHDPHNVGPLDPVTFAATPLLLCAAAPFGCYIPARRATRVDPLVALKTD